MREPEGFERVGQFPAYADDSAPSLRGTHGPLMHVGKTIWMHKETGIVTSDPAYLVTWLAGRASQGSRPEDANA